MITALLTYFLAFDSLGPIDEIRSILSGISYDNVTGKVNSVKGIMNLWIFRHNGTKEKGKLSVDEKALDWEEEFIQKTILDPEITKPDNIKIDGFAERRYVVNNTVSLGHLFVFQQERFSDHVFHDENKTFMI